MQAIKELVLSSKDLQRDIVESGRVSPTLPHSHMTIRSCSCGEITSQCQQQSWRMTSDRRRALIMSPSVHQGAATMKEFYAKNSRWTEGLMSASKAVGWGATVMV